MTAQIISPEALNDDTFYDADYNGYETANGELWDRIGEGNLIWDRTSPWVHIRAALQRTARMHVRGKVTPNE